MEEAIILNISVANVCVVGVPDKRSGEIVIAFVTLRKDSNATDDDIIDHCKEYMVAYKVPKIVSIIEKLPLTIAGKLDKMAMCLLASKLKKN